MNWKTLSSVEQFEMLLTEEKSFAVFKHSTRCSISSMVKNRVESSWKLEDEELPIYYLDLISYRDVSNLISERSGVEHQSPQLIVFSNGSAVYNASHTAIDTNEVASAIARL